LIVTIPITVSNSAGDLKDKPILKADANFVGVAIIGKFSSDAQRRILTRAVQMPALGAGGFSRLLYVFLPDGVQHLLIIDHFENCALMAALHSR
jgi:hypothetical protein